MLPLRPDEPRDDLLPIRSCLDWIAERYAAADAKRWTARVFADGPAGAEAEAELARVGAEYDELARQWSGLFGLLVRFAGRQPGFGGHALDMLRAAQREHPNELRALLVTVLQPELEPLARAITRLERRR